MTLFASYLVLVIGWEAGMTESEEAWKPGSIMDLTNFSLLTSQPPDFSAFQHYSLQASQLQADFNKNSQFVIRSGSTKEEI